MWVGNEAYCTMAIWWIGAWLITIAIQPRMMPVLNSPAHVFNVALMQLVPCRLPAISSVMAPYSELICAPPLRTCCSLAAAEHRSRTSTGK